jgi:hypothetical protein
MRISLAATIVLLFGLSIPAGADDPPKTNPEAGLTQREYRAVTATAPSPGHEAHPATPPMPVHVLTDPAKAALNAVHAQKIIGGKRWKKLSPEQRDDQLRGFQEHAPAGTVYIVEVLTGDVYLVPPADPENTDADYRKAVNDLQGVPPGTGMIHPWQIWEVGSLPVSVSNLPTSGDRGGRAGEAVVVKIEKVD